jgi:hypothetical protein
MHRNPISHCPNCLRKTPKKPITLGLSLSLVRNLRQRVQLCHLSQKKRTLIGRSIGRDGWSQI